jgi:hypothetical protein
MKWCGRVFTVLFTTVAWAQDPVELVRESIAQDQLDWVRMKDYTWQAHSTERHFDARGKVESTKQEKWETLILDGQPYRRMLERDAKPLSPQEQSEEQIRLDRETSRLSKESTEPKFTSQLRDAETGLDFFNARYTSFLSRPLHQPRPAGQLRRRPPLPAKLESVVFH